MEEMHLRAEPPQLHSFPAVVYRFRWESLARIALAISQHQIEIKTNDVNINPCRQASLLKYFHRLINNITNKYLKRTVKKVSEGSIGN